MKSKNKSKKFIYIFINTISITVICFSLVYILSWFEDKKNIEKIQKELETISKDQMENKYEENTLINPTKDKNDPYWYYVNLPFLQVDFSKLLLKNSNTVAWIKVNGTNIDYPVVQTDNNEYYLNHSFDKNKNGAGWIFLDFRNNIDNLNYNTVIYGHGRKDNTMFGSLKSTLTNEWYSNKDNHIIKLSTQKENMIFQIFSVYTIDNENYYINTNFINENLYKNFLQTILNRSIYNFNTSINTDDKILTLSTCKDNSKNRIVVHAKLIKKETNI